MDKRLLISFGLITAAVLTFGCSGGPKPAAAEPKPEPKKEAPKALEPALAQSAFNQMYRPAREWAPDALPLTLASGDISGLKNEGGKAAMWTGVFVSPSRHEARTVIFSAAEHGTRQRGVSLGGAQAWSGATAKSKPFSPTEFLVNSDQAYQAAATKAEAWLKKHPDKKLSLYLASASKGTTPVWIVMWGDTKSGYLAFVNGASGQVVPSR